MRGERTVRSAAALIQFSLIRRSGKGRPCDPVLPRSTVYGLMNFMDPEVAADGSALLNWHLPPDVLDSTIQLVIAAFGEACKRINKVMGWGKLERDLWEIKLWKVYNSWPPPPWFCRAAGQPSERPGMLVTPCPGANRDDVLRTLRDLSQGRRTPATDPGQRRAT